MVRPRWVVFFLFGAILFGCKGRETAHPSVLLITLDTFRADRLGPHTPNLQRLAGTSTVFDHANTAVPLTLPSHATILSGLLPLHHGLRNNGVGAFPKDRATLATLFAAAGYRTGAFVSAFVLDHRFGLNRGFDIYDDAIARDPKSNSPYDAERRSGETVDRAVAWLSRGSAPFFAWVHLYDAHAPYAPPPPYPQTYDGEIAYVDAQAGRLLAAVDRSKTIIAVIGDHGESLGEHGELTHGLLLYQPALHVPMLIAAPDIDRATRHEPVSSADLAPTLASLALQPPLAADGVNLSDDIRRHRDPARRDLYAESQYAVMFGWSSLAAIRRGPMKFIESSSPELYDLSNDPGEQRNLLADERRTFRSLADTLAAIQRTTTKVASLSAVDDETRAKLASLGYVAPSAATKPAGTRPAPAAMASLFRLFEEANWASNDNRPQDAIAKLQSIVLSDPRNPVFRGGLARALRQTGRLREAIPLYKEAVAIAPDDAEAWYNLAVALQEAGQTRESGVVIREAIRRDPRRPEAHNALGIAYTAEGNLEAAQEEFAKAIAIDPRDARAFTNLANVHRAIGRLDDGEHEYRQALALVPDYADALNGLGVLEVQRDRPQVAIPYFDRALRVAPNLYEAQLNRGIALQLMGNRIAAAEQFRTLLTALPRSAEFAAQRRAASELLSRLQRRR